MKAGFIFIGVIVVLAGLHWIGQGTGCFAWPRNLAMEGNGAWTFFGAVVTVAGLVILGYGVRRRRQ